MSDSGWRWFTAGELAEMSDPERARVLLGAYSVLETEVVAVVRLDPGTVALCEERGWGVPASRARPTVPVGQGQDAIAQMLETQRHRVLAVRCVQCGAAPGEECNGRRGALMNRWQAHVDRVLMAPGSLDW